MQDCIQREYAMKIQKEGFGGQKLIRLPKHIRETLAEDPITGQLFLTDIGLYPPVNNHRVVRNEPLQQQILIYCTDGEGWCKFDGKIHTVKKNSYFIVPAGSPHAYGNTEGKHWAIYWIHFNGIQSSRYSEQLCDRRFGEGIPLIPRRELFQLFHETIVDLENGLTPESCANASARLWHLLGEISYHRRFASDKDKNTIDKAIMFLKEKVEEDVSLEEVAAHLHLSTTYFCRLFKKRIGQSPINYFILLKIQRSCQYLNFTSMTIHDVAFQLGYEDPYYFSRVFKRVMGMSPKNYRNKHAY